MTRFDLPTLFVLLICYAGFGLATTVIFDISALAGFVLAMLAVTLHSSLQHEILHGHLTRNRVLAVAMVFPAMGMFIPYERFQDLHLQHHHDESLTDPYDDPESNYLDPAVWQSLPRWKKSVFQFNNTLLGRILIGPAIALASFYRENFKSILAGDTAVIRAFILHTMGVMIILAWLLSVGTMPFGIYLLACYCGHGILKIRTFLEHRAHVESGGRTVIIEDRSILAFLFLNNNFHALHHEQPDLRWYELPRIYAAERQGLLARNDHYFYKSYAEIFRRYFLRAKDGVAHPLR